MKSTCTLYIIIKTIVDSRDIYNYMVLIMVLSRAVQCPQALPVLQHYRNVCLCNTKSLGGEAILTRYWHNTTYYQIALSSVYIICCGLPW